MFLMDESNNIVAKSILVQTDDPEVMKEQETEKTKSFSFYPREKIETWVEPGNYYLEISMESDNFSPKDHLRLTSDSESVEFIDPGSENVGQESIVNPADNASVITVGAADDERSSWSQSLQKPDLKTFSDLHIKSKDKSNLSASAIASAIVAAGITLLKEQDSSLDKNAILETVAIKEENFNRPIDLAVLGFDKGPGKKCFVAASWDRLTSYAADFIRDTNAVLVRTNHGYKFAVPYDPITLTKVQRTHDDDIVMLTLEGVEVFPREQEESLSYDTGLEVFQLPLNEKLCAMPPDWRREPPKDSNLFYLN
jgi:hypothetical protein